MYIFINIIDKKNEKSKDKIEWVSVCEWESEREKKIDESDCVCLCVSEREIEKSKKSVVWERERCHHNKGFAIALAKI